jgi:hypothetical protein
VYTAISDHLEKSSTGMEILGVLLQMLRKIVDLLRKNSDLDIRRTGVCVVPSHILDDGCLFLSGKHG